MKPERPPNPLRRKLSKAGWYLLGPVIGIAPFVFAGVMAKIVDANLLIGCFLCAVCLYGWYRLSK